MTKTGKQAQAVIEDDDFEFGNADATKGDEGAAEAEGGSDDTDAGD